MEASPAKRFCADCGAALGTAAPAQAASAVPVAPPTPAAAAERRQLTVMFCDLVGSTPLAARLDPEDMREVIAAYHGHATALIQSAGGFVAKYVGDGVLAYFGYPQAREEDAECAARAGLAIAQGIGRLASPAGPPGALQARVGIASGLVVVGMSDAGKGEAHSVVGDTPNLAARLQTLAAPGAVVIDPATRRQIGGLFACEDLGPQSLKGVAEPVRAWQVQAEIRGRSRFEALRAERLTRLVGREEELDLLLRRWRQARDGEGRVVLIQGEPGIGKSRLADALETRLRSEACARLHYFCAPYHVDSALHPVIAQMERAAGFARDDAPEDKARKLRSFLAGTDTPEEDAGLIAALLSVPADGPPLPEQSPQRRKERTFEALIRQVEGAARRMPVMLLVEDAHWMDPSSRELLDLMVERMADLPSLLVITYRPEFQPPWIGRAGVSLVALSRLDRRQAAEIVVQVAARTGLAGDLLERIVAGADGVPLFIEELTKAVLENTAGPDRLAVPSTLQASLMARLDRLPAAREVAQVGAVIGRTFSHALVAAVAQLPEPALRQGIADLLAAGLASRRGEPPEAIYTFKHALVQDAAYESLLRSRRTALHARVADALLRQDPGIEDTQPEVLGYHCAEAKRLDDAARYFLHAGQRAAGRSAMAEAHAHLARGLALSAEMPDGPARQLHRAELHVALGNVKLATHGGGYVGHAVAFAEAAELSRALPLAEPHRTRFATRALYGAWSSCLNKGDLDAALAIAEEYLQLGRGQKSLDVRLFAGHVYSASCFFLGRFADAWSASTEALPPDQEHGRESRSIAKVGIDAEALCRVQFSRVLACMGYAEQAIQQANWGVERARRLHHLPSLAITLSFALTTAWIVRDLRSLQEMSGALTALSGEQGFGFWLTRGKSYAGWLMAQEGDAGRGRALIEESLSELRAAGAGIYGPDTSAMLADAYARDGRNKEALGAVEAGLDVMARTGEAWAGAELHRRKGEFLLAEGAERGPEGAEALFHRAVALAKGQSAKLFELRAAASLARLWLSQGRRAEARDLLAPIHGWFTEGFYTPDLKEAGALLKAAG